MREFLVFHKDISLLYGARVCVCPRRRTVGWQQHLNEDHLVSS
jgi:hypothetical protein